MKDLITALGLLLFIEGLFFALFPTRMKNMLKTIEAISSTKLRSVGIFFLILGFIIVWYIKNKCKNLKKYYLLFFYST